MNSERAYVYFKEHYAGTLFREDGDYVFRYEDSYVASAQAQPVSLTLPLRDEAYRQKTLFSFFDGLIPEGWLLDIATEAWKINSRDRFQLLQTLCEDCIGAVSIRREKL
jgi:serine/threonine-protein kinase HipA